MPTPEEMRRALAMMGGPGGSPGEAAFPGATEDATPAWQAQGLYDLSRAGMPPVPPVAAAAPPPAPPPGPQAPLSAYVEPGVYDLSQTGPAAEEARFQREIRATPWFQEFKKKNGGEPVLDDPDYDYRAAWKAGIRPQRYGHDGGAYHWSSSLPDGTMLKSENHPTAWMEHFMRATGVDPNELGLKSKEEGEAYLASHGKAGASGVAGPVLPKRPGAGSLPNHKKMLREQQAYLGAAAEDAGAAESALAQGIDVEADAMGGAQMAVADAAKQRSELLKQQSIEAERLGAEQQAVVDRRLASADEAQRIARGYQAQADQFQVRDRRSTGQKIGGSIAMALGGIGDALQRMGGVQNVASHVQEIIDASIDRDLEEQMQALDSKKDAARAKWSEYGLAREQVGDAETAKQMALAALDKKYATQAEAIAQSGISDQAAEQAVALAQNLRNRAEQRTADNAARLMDKAEERTFQLQDKVVSEDRAAAAAGAGKGGWGRYTVEQLQQAKAAGQLPADGEKYLADVLKGGAEAMSATNKATGKDGGHMSDGDKKLARLAAGVQPAVDYLSPYLQANKSIPYFGVRKGTGFVPDIALPEENLKFAKSVEALSNVMLRDESGAALPPSEIEAKKQSWGIDSGDPEIRKEGLRRMMLEFAARRSNGRDEGGPVRFTSE